jgi:hypothetical protein
MLHAKMCFVSNSLNTPQPQEPGNARLQPPHGSIYIRAAHPAPGIVRIFDRVCIPSARPRTVDLTGAPHLAGIVHRAIVPSSANTVDLTATATYVTTRGPTRRPGTLDGRSCAGRDADSGRGPNPNRPSAAASWSPLSSNVDVLSS